MQACYLKKYKFIIIQSPLLRRFQTVDKLSIMSLSTVFLFIVELMNENLE